jgi:hypothetical protein
MAGNFRIDHLGAKRVQSAERPFLVGFVPVGFSVWVSRL